MAVELTKQAPTISFEKQEAALLDLTLSWTTHTDVDLACMYEMVDGEKGVIQALDKNFGTLGKPPYVRLDRDDRSGGTERLEVNMTRADKIRRLLPFAYIYQGGDWNKVGDAEVMVRHSRVGDFLIRLSGAKAMSCALVDIQNTGDGNLSMTRLEQYFRGTHEEIDRYYGWPGFNWHQATKD